MRHSTKMPESVAYDPNDGISRRTLEGKSLVDGTCCQRCQRSLEDTHRFYGTDIPPMFRKASLMTYTISTVHKNALTALTALTTRMRKSSVQQAGTCTIDLRRPVSAPTLTQEERLAADYRFHILRNQAADMVALMDECISEPRDRSDWVVPKHRELRRYGLLDASQLRHRPWLDYCDFAELYAAAQVVEMSCHQAPRDLIGLDRYLTLSEMVFDCLYPTGVQTERRTIL